ncbi:MAG TPA: PP0621 family protein [Casimicrobiaceae bacterium]|nr:PP0621 family protein [Casimicrobiaceae bacterium]
MGKIIFWIVVFFVILFALRMLSIAKSRSRDEAKREAPRKAIPPAEPTVRCAECGVFLPKSEATPIATGHRCADPSCPRRH